MAPFHSVVLVLFISLLWRIFMFMFSIHDWIYSRIEFSTPVTSWKRGQLFTIIINMRWFLKVGLRWRVRELIFPECGTVGAPSYLGYKDHFKKFSKWSFQGRSPLRKLIIPPPPSPSQTSSSNLRHSLNHTLSLYS